MDEMANDPLLPEDFQRVDETPDEAFYATPRLVVHIDDGAIAGLRQYFGEVLQPGAAILDLMSSWRSHLPEDMSFSRVVGLGLNDVELAENPGLTERCVHNLNTEPRIPFGEAEFDAVLLTVSVQYLVHPVEVFSEVGRVLKPGGRLIVSFSNRMFATKAVRIWYEGSDPQHRALVLKYFSRASCFEDVQFHDRTPSEHGDPLYVVSGRRLPR